MSGTDGSDEPTWRTRVRALVVHSSQPKLLAIRVNSLQFPEFELRGSPWVGEPQEFRPALRELIGVDADLLRCIGQTADERAHAKFVTLLFAARSDPELADSLAWISTADVDAIADGHADATAVLAELATGTRNECMPWTNRGWHAEAEEWLRTSMRENGTPVVGVIEPILTWELSCVLRAQTASGPVYFKRALDTPLFANEGPVVAELAALFPADVPKPLAVDPDRRFLVLADAGPIVGWDASIETREEVMRAAARLQIRSAPHVDRLLAAGCIDRRLDWLAVQAIRWPDEVDLSPWLSFDDVALVRSAGRRLAQMCAELAALPVPHTIVQGDLHLGNVARGEHGFVIFDWTDACIAHPFIDMIAIGWEDDLAVRTSLLNAYLDEWRQFGSTAELDHAWQLAQPLTALNHAIGYVSLWSSVAQEAADREFGRYAARFLQSLVRALRADG
jgi:hypothetical protein